MEKEFDDQISVIAKLSLDHIYGMDPLFVIDLIKRAIEHFINDFLHPAGIKEAELSRLRDIPDKSVEEWISLLFFTWLPVHGGNLEKSWVNVADNFSYDSTLSGCIPAFKDNHYRK